MNRRVVSLSALLVLAVATLAVVILFVRPGKRSTGPLRHEAYVWQRAWSPPVRDAVTQHGTNFSSLSILKAEISWKDKQPQIVRVPVDYGALAATKLPVGLALRIGPYAGPFVTNDLIGSYVIETAA